MGFTGLSDSSSAFRSRKILQFLAPDRMEQTLPELRDQMGLNDLLRSPAVDSFQLRRQNGKYTTSMNCSNVYSGLGPWAYVRC